MDKITIIGAGRVGEATARLLAIRDMAREVVLIDVRDGAAEGLPSIFMSHRPCSVSIRGSLGVSRMNLWPGPTWLSLPLEFRASRGCHVPVCLIPT
jgi:hypothetical protein